jgi:hypothetical protein
LTLTVLFLACL